MMLLYFIVAMIIAAAAIPGAHASEPKPTAAPAPVIASDPRGKAELTICSQNMNNYGKQSLSMSRLGISPEEYAAKQAALVKRFVSVGCDVIAVQELLGKTEEIAELALQELAKALRAKSGRVFATRVGATNDPVSRVGFLVAEDRADIQNLVSYRKVELPKLTAREKPRVFLRAPLELQLSVRPFGEGPAKIVSLVNFHFKSKGGKGRDPAELEFETYRMQMAEALRRVLENRYTESFGSGELTLVVLGDRNSNFDTASARLLEGSLTLKHFQGETPCRLSKRGVPLCKANTYLPQRLFSVLTTDPQTKLQPGTFKYKSEYSWIDDIAVPAESLRYAWERFDREGDYASGLIDEPAEASDHAMIYVKLNW